MLEGLKDAAAGALESTAQVIRGEPAKGIQLAEDFYADALHEQKTYYPRWYRNLAYLMGQQWLDFQSQYGFFTLPPAPTWRVRLVINLIKPKIRAEVGKILRNNPSFAAVPANGDPESIAGAKVGSRLLEGIYYSDDFQRKLYNLTMWFTSCTSAFLWSVWDPSAGRSWEEQEKDPVTGEATGKLLELAEGDVVHDVSGPFETFLEAGAPEDFNEHRRIMRVKVRTVEYIKDKYGVDVAPEQLGQEVLFQARIAGMGRLNASMGDLTKRSTRGLALVKEFFEAPTSGSKQGQRFVYAGGKYLVDPEPLDYYLHGKRALPVAKFDHLTVPGCAWAQSLIDDCAPLQELFNKMSSKVVENANMLGRPKILAPQGAMDEDVFTDEPGEVVEYVPIGGMKPEAFKPPEMPQYVLNMRDQIPALIDRVSGVQDVSEGRLPRRATSGKAITLLQEADDSSTAPTIKNMSSALERVMSITLSTYGRRASETRLIRQLGANRKMDVYNFKAADLMGADSVRVVIVPALSRGEKVDIALQLAEQELIPRDMALKIMELGDLNLLYDQDQDQTSYAEFENMGMAKGVMYPVGKLEDHHVHVQVHQKFLNSPKAQMLPPEVRQIFEAHILEHEQLDLLAQQQLGMAPLPPAGAGPVIPGGGAQEG